MSVGEMTYRDRVLGAVGFTSIDALPFRLAFGLMPGVLESWREQGLPAGVQSINDVYDYFGFPRKGRALPVNLLFDPPFEERVLSDDASETISIDNFGRKTRLLKGYSTLPLAMEFPVRDEQSWREYARRLVFHPGRIGADLERVVEGNRAAGLLNILGTYGFYWFPRDLLGDEELCIAYYERPELVEQILDTYCTMLEKILHQVLARVKMDCFHLGEDMAYRNGPMIGPDLFERFVSPYYRRINRLLESHGVPIFSVDSDGRLSELLPWLIECGVNFIGPCEVQAGNDLRELRGRFGKKMSFEGGLDKRVLIDGPEAIDRMLLDMIPPMKRSGGGWIISLDHRVIAGTTLKNFQHFVDRTRELSRF